MTTPSDHPLIDAPQELQAAIAEFWPPSDWDNAAAISYLESGWDFAAEADTRRPEKPCGARLYQRDGLWVTAEWSLGYFQINVCNLPDDWDPRRLFNARENAGTAHALWERAAGWAPWTYSARALGLL